MWIVMLLVYAWQSPGRHMRKDKKSPDNGIWITIKGDFIIL